MKNSKKSAIALALVIGVLTAGGVAIKSAQASTNKTNPPFVQAMIDKFHLNQSDVDKLREEWRAKRQAERAKETSSALDKAVKDGVITESQKKLIVEKQAKERDEHLKEEGPRMSKGSQGKEMREWMEQNGIDFQKLSSYLRPANRGNGMGRGMMNK